MFQASSCSVVLLETVRVLKTVSLEISLSNPGSRSGAFGNGGCCNVSSEHAVNRQPRQKEITMDSNNNHVLTGHTIDSNHLLPQHTIDANHLLPQHAKLKV